jgi:hypothetical protein
MPYIAKTNGATSGQPLEIREGQLSDIPTADQANWREVDVIQPTIANNDLTVRTSNYFEILSDGRCRMLYNTDNVPEPWLKLTLRRYAAQRRWEHSQQGTVINGTHYQTDDVAIAKIMGAKMLIDSGAVTTVNWKHDGGWVDLDQTAMNAVFGGVSAFIQNCYTTEQTVIGLIDDGTYTTRAQIAGHAWP